MKYKLTQKYNKNWLLNNNWRFSKTFSDEDEEVYTHRFSVYRYGLTVTLEAELMLFTSTNEVKINVYDAGTNYKYAPFYYVEYGNFTPILEIINKNVNRELKKMGIKKYD